MYSRLQIFLVCTNTGFGFWLNSPFLLFFQFRQLLFHLPSSIFLATLEKIRTGIERRGGATSVSSQ